MTPVLVVPILLLVAAVAVIAWLTARVVRSVGALQAELVVLSPRGRP